jgi:hypothetical protein
MPSGYTYQIAEGMTFQQFVWRCARASGVLIGMRDDPQDAPIDVDGAGYNDIVKQHEQYLEEARRRCYDVERMTLVEAGERARVYYERRHAEWEESRAEATVLRGKYEAMLAQVARWSPPTPHHEDLKRFMIDQLKDSIYYDCDVATSEPVLTAADEWLRQEREHAPRGLEYARGNLERVIQCQNKLVEWLRALRDSVPLPSELVPRNW